jgi:hypothetical protein
MTGCGFAIHWYKTGLAAQICGQGANPGHAQSILNVSPGDLWAGEIWVMKSEPFADAKPRGTEWACRESHSPD